MTVWLTTEAPHETDETVGYRRVEARRGLIKDKESRSGHELGRHCKALPFTATEAVLGHTDALVPDQRVTILMHAQLIYCPTRPVLTLFLGEALVAESQICCEFHGLMDLFSTQENIVLIDKCQIALDPRRGDLMAV